MRLKNLIAAGAALSLVATPAFAGANPAASLSVAKPARAAAPTTRTSRIGSGGIVAAIMAAVLVGTIAIAITTDDNDSDSN